MATEPNIWKSRAEAKERAEELRIALEQYTRKEITLKQLVHILRPEIEALARRMQQAETDAGTPPTRSFQEHADAFTATRLRTDGQVLSMLRACINDAEQAAGMWERKEKRT